MLNPPDREIKTKIAIIFHEDFGKYDLGPNHPFRGDRYNHLPEVFGNEAMAVRKSDVTIIKPKSAADEYIRAVHGEDYLNFIESMDKRGGLLTLDTPIPPGLYKIAKLFVGANILAGRLIAEGIFKRVIVLGLGAHHAGYDFGGGFCMINDIAVMIEYLRKFYNIKRIMAIDYDAHCGDGTQDIYYDSPDVLCLDLHQDPMTLFPGKGFAYQIGLGKGKGYTVNIPLPPGSSDEDFISAFDEICLPVAAKFQPEIIVANGGLDAHFADPLSQLNLSLKGYFWLMTRIVDLSRQLCGDKLILILGGGYGPGVVPSGWITMISAMLEIKEIDISEPVEPPGYSEEASRQARDMIREVKVIHKIY